MPPVSASGTPLKTSSASRGDAERRVEQQEDQEEADRHDDRQALRARRPGSRTARPSRASSPGGSLHLLRRSCACASATNEPMSRPRTLACTTTRRLPFSRLIWFGPSANANVATLLQRHECAARAVRARRRQRHRQVLQRLEIVAHRVRQAHDDRRSGGRPRRRRRPRARRPRRRSRPARRDG